MAANEQTADIEYHAVILVGRPGSGKTAARKDFPEYSVLSQDEGPKTWPALLRKFKQSLGPDCPRILVDRPNPRPDQRAKLITAARAAGYRTTILWLDVPREECARRIADRKNHPKIQNAAAAARALTRFDADFVAPSEGDADALEIRGRGEAAPAIGDDLHGESFDRAVLLLVSLQSHSAVVRALQRIGLQPAAAVAAMEAARLHLAAVAGYDAVEQLGTALTRLNDIYRRSLAVHDVKNALATQKELNKLLSLARFRAPDAEHGGPAGELAAVRQYLEPLGLADSETPVAELARLAVAQLVAARRDG